MFNICLYTVLSVSCSLVISCLERADLLALLCEMFPCVCVTFPCGVSGQVWYFIVMIPDICLLFYFYMYTVAYYTSFILPILSAPVASS